MAAGLQEFKQISLEEWETANREAWSLECMTAHGVEERTVEYIGSQLGGPLDGDCKNGTAVFDYYRDSENGYWYQTRAWVPDRGIVSMDQYIFGCKRRRRQGSSGPWQKRGQARKHNALHPEKNVPESEKK